MPQDQSRFGRYILISKLGMGGMAEVFKAQHRKNPDLVFAIKKILPQFSQDKKLVSMLVNEARLSMGLNHPNIVPVLDFGMVEGDYFIAMEYVKGKDLKSIMIRCKTKKIDLPVHMSVYVISQVLRALSHAHNKRDNFDQPLSIVHRDISPHNVLISYWGEVKILDFGIAKASSLAGSTQTGILKGKFSYMAPEQARGEEVDHRTDLFSTGIVLWELLTLESYYHADSDIKLLTTVREAQFRDPAQVNPKVPRALSLILETALQKKEKKRFQSADEFLNALEKYQNDTFGEVTDADLAAYIRSLFGISAEEILLSPPPQRPKLPESSAQQFLTSGQSSRPIQFRIHFEIPGWAWKGSLALFAATFLTWLFAKSPPRELFTRYNRWVDSAAIKLYQKRSPKSNELGIQVDPPTLTRPNYSLTYVPGVRESLDDLPFEIADRIRIQIEDLAFDVRPTKSEAAPDRPGFWTISQAGYRILYSFTDQPKKVTVRSVERAH